MSQLGISGRIARAFQNSAITPLLAIVGLLLGFFAIAVTPKEEEPQIDVTFANVFIAYPGASAKEVENLISTPAEQVLSEINGVDDIYSVSRPGMAILTVAFEVGRKREEALLNLYNQIYSNADWLPANLGAGQPLVNPKGIDDVPIMALTLSSENALISQQDLTQLAHTLEVELKRVPGTRDIYTIGEHNQVVNVRLDPVRLNAYGITLENVRNTLLASNLSASPSNIVQNNQLIQLQAGDFLGDIQQVQQLIVGLSRQKAPVYLADVADIKLQADVPEQQVFQFKKGQRDIRPALTIAIAKQPGMNAIDITSGIEAKLAQLKNNLIPADVQVDISRNYGETAKNKSDKLIGKLLFATAAVVILVLLTMSWREAIIVGGAIFITLAITLFASWAWGFTLNRVSLCALIFSIGILVDDAIVVVENIHRHLHMGGKKLLDVIPIAVDEVGGPTILATFTVIAALMPMAFVSGLMGPDMSPIPINASTGMIISLIVAFVVTPWLSYKLLKNHIPAGHAAHDEEDVQHSRLHQFFERIMRPFIEGETSRSKRNKLGLAVLGMIIFAMALPVGKLVVMKMLPFDNKSEFQVIVDMPEGTPMENTLMALQALGEYLKTVPEVSDYQLYAGTSAPINFNGLVRQYYLRSEAHQGDIQVNLVDKHHRDKQSHDIASAMRDPLQKIGLQFNANVKIVEVPPGPPVMSPLVAEVYGANYPQQIIAAKQLREKFSATKDVVDVDDSIEADQEKWLLHIDRQKAAMQQVPYSTLVNSIRAAMGGEDVSYLHQEQQKYAIPIRLEFKEADKQQMQGLMQMKVRNLQGEMLPVSEFISLEKTIIDKTIYHKNLLPVVFVTADMAGELDSPLYAMFDIAGSLTESGVDMPQTYIAQPDVTNSPRLKWDGEWQITYETFRDMGIAYGIGMILIYLLVVAQFRSYLVPLIIMAPIPLTIIGVMPGHALFGAQFTATSMIGMIALAGIIVRNSILLVDFINQEIAAGKALVDSVINAAAVRAKPIALTGVAAMTGAFFILDDPIFNGLAISLIFGIFISTLLTLVVIPLLYFSYQEWLAEKPATQEH
jgi:multidrug efflux pump subunit AcrB